MYINLYNLNIRHAYTLEELENWKAALNDLQGHTDKDKSNKAEHDCNFLNDYINAIKDEQPGFISDVKDHEKDGVVNTVKFKLTKGEVPVNHDDKECKEKITKYGIEPEIEPFVVTLKTKPAKHVNSRKTFGVSYQNVKAQVELFLKQQLFRGKGYEFTGEYIIRSHDRKKVIFEGKVEK